MNDTIRVFIDSDVLIAGSASTSGASHIVLQLSDLTLIKGITSSKVKEESERNLYNKLPQALPACREILNNALQVVSNPDSDVLESYSDLAHPKDVAIISCAIEQNCNFLLTFNTSDYYAGKHAIEVCPPGQFLEKIRDLLSEL